MKASIASIEAFCERMGIEGKSAQLPGDPDEAVIDVPISTNAIWRSVVIRGKLRVMKSEKYRVWIESNIGKVKHMAVRTCPASVSITLCGTTKALDIDNLTKSPIDLLRAAGVLLNDNINHVRKLTIEWKPDKINGQPAAIVRLSDYAAEAV